ncbi:TIGR02254 family HAD hydrolase [Enterococcus sp. DIV2402]|uniref:TIGR02254 family HAD hydrolase n=1 Tax=Candidatus Enterococcus lowellii TaxID=2230877 RepID=A0ABZ2SQW4_9ENTE|nr:YjjG family noncanonical pyrimidine nucleotidase [Enterococcus sp. DIV2402]MBO0464599.1 YjjG family noncanonical pyrimidine nucleotidase [Enterococcus sp. DIV2402]
MYKALFIDIDDTLLNFEQCSIVALKTTFQELAIPYSDNVYDHFHKIDQSLWKEQKMGKRTVQEVLDTRFELLETTLEITDKAKSLQEYFQLHLSNTFVLENNVFDIIHYLSSRYSLFVTSNGVLDVQMKRMALAKIDTFFVDFFVSSNIGFDKPDKRFFNYCLDKSGFLPEEVLLIGDSLEADIVGGNNVSIDTCWYNSKELDNHLNTPINYQIKDLIQLKQFL